MTTTRRHFIAAASVSAASAGLALPSAATWAQSRPKLVVGLQTVDLRETVIASKVLDGHDHTLDHIAPTIAKFDFLSDADKKKIFEDNARAVFRLDQ